MEKSLPFSLSLDSNSRTLLRLLTFVALLVGSAVAQSVAGPHAQLNQLVDQNAANWKKVSQQIWQYAELGYHETKSSALLQEQLRAAGFHMQVTGHKTLSMFSRYSDLFSEEEERQRQLHVQDKRSAWRAALPAGNVVQMPKRTVVQ